MTISQVEVVTLLLWLHSVKVGGMADESLYKVTYRSGRVAVCNRRSLAGKIGLMHSEQGRWVYNTPGDYRSGGRHVRDRQASPRHDIVKVERAPIGGWQDVTKEFIEQPQD